MANLERRIPHANDQHKEQAADSDLLVRFPFP